MLANTPIARIRTCITCTDRATQTDGVVLPGGIIANEDAPKYMLNCYLDMTASSVKKKCFEKAKSVQRER